MKNSPSDPGVWGCRKLHSCSLPLASNYLPRALSEEGCGWADACEAVTVASPTPRKPDILFRAGAFGRCGGSTHWLVGVPSLPRASRLSSWHEQRPLLTARAAFLTKDALEHLGAGGNRRLQRCSKMSELPLSSGFLFCKYIVCPIS